MHLLLLMIKYENLLDHEKLDVYQEAMLFVGGSENCWVKFQLKQLPKISSIALRQSPPEYRGRKWQVLHG